MRGNPPELCYIQQFLREKRDVGTDRWSEHGLGHLLNPTDPESEDRDWIEQVWLKIVREALDLSLRLHYVFNSTSEEVLCVFVHEVDVTALHAASKKHSICVFYHLRKPFAGSFYYGVEGFCFVTSPVCQLRNIDQITPEDNANMIKLKSLGRVDAADLVYAPGIVRPEVLFRYANCKTTCVRPGIPRPRITFDNDIVQEGAIVGRLGPRPAKPSCYSRGRSSTLLLIAVSSDSGVGNIWKS